MNEVIVRNEKNKNITKFQTKVVLEALKERSSYV